MTYVEDQTTVLSKLNRDRLKYTYNTKMFWLWLEKKARPIYNNNGFNFFFFFLQYSQYDISMYELHQGRHLRTPLLSVV